MPTDITNCAQFSKRFRCTTRLSWKPRAGIKWNYVVEGDAALASEPTKGNLVHRAIEAARKELGWKRGVHATLTKHIPVGRGLGGGSSDAAAALIGMMRLARKQIPAERLIEIGSSLGADVPFFLYGGRALGIGRGDEIYPLPDGPHHTVLVVSPSDIAVRYSRRLRLAGGPIDKPL